jgi:hypothetical protein
LAQGFALGRPAVVQEWRVDDAQEIGDELRYVHWLAGDTKLAWIYLNGTELYDFEKNLKYRWGPAENDKVDGNAKDVPVFSQLARDWFAYEPEGWFGTNDKKQNVALEDTMDSCPSIAQRSTRCTRLSVS